MLRSRIGVPLSSYSVVVQIIGLATIYFVLPVMKDSCQ